MVVNDAEEFHDDNRGILLYISPFQCNTENIHFLEKRRNVIIKGFFTKLVYSNLCISLNALFMDISLPIRHIGSINKFSFQGYLYPSGILDSCRRGYEEIVKLKALEEQIIHHYLSQTMSTKIPFYSLGNQLDKGSIKVYLPDRSSESSSNFARSRCTIFGRGTEGITGGCPDANSEQGIFTDDNNGNFVHMRDIYSISSRPMNGKMLLKISGVWESDSHVGITYKFCMVV